MVQVAVTGADSALGERVLHAVRRLDDVDRAVGIDVDASAEDLAGVDVLVHLLDHLAPGGATTPGGPEAARSQSVVEAAVRAGVRKVVQASSVVVYGAHPDNDLPLTEESPLRTNAAFPWAERLRDAEGWLAVLAGSHHDLTATRLRLAMVVGSGVDTGLTRALQAPRLPSVRGHRPPFQFVDVDDVAGAVAHAVRHDLPGPYNVAAEGWLSFHEAASALHRRPLDVPEEVAFSTLERLRALGVGVPLGAVHHLMHPCVVSVDRLVATGWRPRHSNREAVARLADALGDRVVVGPVTTSRHEVRRAATVSAGIVGGVLALGILARRRSRGGS